MKNKKYSPVPPFPLSLFLYSLLPIPPASAHKVKIAEDVGATLHIEPNDNPRAGEPAQAWFALTRKGGKAVPLAECNCQLSVFAEPRTDESALLKPSLKSVVAERYQGIPGADITFPKPGAYQLQLTGKAANGDFKPFEFKFEVIVAAGTSQPTPTAINSTSATEVKVKQEPATIQNNSPFSPVVLIGLSGLVIVGIVFAVLQQKRKI